MSPKNISKNANAAVIAAIQSHVLCWSKWINNKYLRPKHIRFIADYLMALEQRDIKRLIVETPPRHGKTELISIGFPGWYLGRNPDHRVITVSHTARLAERNSRIVRSTIREFGPSIWGINVAKDSAAADRWDLGERRGGLVAAGVDGGLTGMGADLLIVDDPIKTAEHAYSAIQREKVWHFYTHVARTRLAPGAIVVIVGTRWHEDDLIGRLLADNVEDWVRLRLPAICDDNDDLLGRMEGEALWPEWFSENDLATTKKQVGSTVWSALYQQRPASIEGAIIKKSWLRYYDELPKENLTWVHAWDPSFRKTNDGSFVVGQVWVSDRKNYYLVDQFRKRCNYTDQKRAIIQMAEKWPEMSVKLIEARGSGDGLIADLRGHVPGIRQYEPGGQVDIKVVRLRYCEPMFEAGQVFLPNPEHQPWVKDFVDELVTFPYGPRDDQVDAASIALSHFKKERPIPLLVSGSVNSRKSPWMSY